MKGGGRVGGFGPFPEKGHFKGRNYRLAKGDVIGGPFIN